MPEKKYRARHGSHAGQIGIMIGRFCDPSYNDIRLQFDDGEKIWFNFNDVSPVD